MHSFRVRVYFSDTDACGIVYHARYLDFAEHARTEMLRAALPEVPQRWLACSGLMFVVRSISIDYIRPAYLDDELQVISSMDKIGNVSAVIKQDIMREDDLIASISVRVGFIDGRTGKPSRIPAFIKDALA